MKDTAISLARTAISLGSVCLALLSVSIPSSSSLLSLPSLIRVLLSLAGFILILSAALLLDWAIDMISNEEWDKMNEKMKQLGDTGLDSDRGPKARMKLFGGGYFLISIGMGFVAFAMLFLLIIHFAILSEPLLLVSTIVSAFCGVGIIIKMMTLKLGTVAVTILVIGGAAVISIALNIYLLTH